MRYVGVDFGLRRIGLAVSDASATLARPWKTIAAGESLEASASRVAAVVTGEASEAAALESGAAAAADIAGVVIGLPRRLGGEDSDLTAAAREFAGKVAAASGLAVYLQDERLTSHAADERLAARERDWRRRKQKLDAAAAAVMLQDFLDALPRQTAATPAADSEC